MRLRIENLDEKQATQIVNILQLHQPKGGECKLQSYNEISRVAEIEKLHVRKSFLTFTENLVTILNPNATVSMATKVAKPRKPKVSE
jgi:hypothetical protein